MTATEALLRLKAGDETAFDAFYEGTRRKVFYTAFKVLNDKNLAEDVMQDTYVSFLNALDKIDGAKNPIAYLLTSAKNKALNVAKRARREISVDFNPETDGRSLVSYPEYTSPLLTLAKKMFTAEEFWLLHLIAIEGYSKTDVAKRLKMPLTTVAWQYRQIVKRLKTEYDKEEALENK